MNALAPAMPKIRMSMHILSGKKTLTVTEQREGVRITVDDDGIARFIDLTPYEAKEFAEALNKVRWRPGKRPEGWP